MALKRFPSVSSMSSGGRKSDRGHLHRSAIRVPKDSFKRLTDSFINARLNQESSLSIESGQDKVSKTITTLMTKLSKDKTCVLKLRNKALTDTHCVALAQAIREVPVLVGLDLRENTVTDVGASALIKAMEDQAKASMNDWRVGSKPALCLASVQLQGNIVSQILLAKLQALEVEAKRANVDLEAAWVFVLCLESKDPKVKAAFVERLGQGRSCIRLQTGNQLKSARRLRKALAVLLHRTVRSKELNIMLRPYGLVQIEKTVNSRRSTFIGQLDGEITGIDLPTFVDLCQTQLAGTVIPKIPLKSVLHPHLEAETGKEELSEIGLEKSEHSEALGEEVGETEEVKTSSVNTNESTVLEQPQLNEQVRVDVVPLSPPKQAEAVNEVKRTGQAESPVSASSEEIVTVGKENIQEAPRMENNNGFATESKVSKNEIALKPAKVTLSLNVSRRELTSLASVIEEPGLKPSLLEELDASWNMLGVDSAYAFMPQSTVLGKLVRLNLSHNNLTSSSFGILVECVPAVEDLNLSYNSITSLVGLEALHATSVLNLGCNNIKDASTLASMKFLSSLDLSDNKISSVSALRGISLNVKLRSLHLKGNPLAFHSRYRAQIMHLVPFLDSLDNKPLPVSSVKRRTKHSKSPVKNKKSTTQISKRQAAAAAALSAGSTAYASVKKKSERLRESGGQELLQELDKLASKRESRVDEDEMARVLEQMPADQLRQYIVELYRSEKSLDGKRSTEKTSGLRRESPRTSGSKDGNPQSKAANAHKRLSMPKKLSSRSPTSSKRSNQPRRHTGNGVNSLVKVSASLLSPTDAFRRKTVEGAKAAEEKAKLQREAYLNELKRNRQRRKMQRAKQPVVSAVSSVEVKLEPRIAKSGVVEAAKVEMDSVVNETRFQDWNSEALQQARAAETALQSLLRLSTKSDISADLQEFKEKLVDVGLWKRMSLPSIDLTPADNRYKYVKEVIEKVELAKAAVRNFVNILETVGPASNKVKHYKDYIAEYDPVASALKLLSKDDAEPSTVEDKNEAERPAPRKAVDVDKVPVVKVDAPAERERSTREQRPRKSSRSSLEEEKEQIIGPVAIRSLLQQSRRGQAQGGIAGSTNSVKFRMPTTREEGVSLPDELVRQREERQFYYDNESVASSVWSIEGQASVKHLQMEFTLRSNNEQETSDNTSDTGTGATHFVQTGSVPAEQPSSLPAPIVESGNHAGVGASIAEHTISEEELPKQEEEAVGPKEPNVVVSNADEDTDDKIVGEEEENTTGEAQKQEDSLADRIDKALERSKEDRTDEELSLFSDISGLSEDAGDELLPE